MSVPTTRMRRSTGAGSGWGEHLLAELGVATTRRRRSTGAGWGGHLLAALGGATTRRRSAGSGWGEHLLAELGGASHHHGAALLGQDRVRHPAKKCGSRSS